ncbi:autotransporter outer membrane beta-barrel domain-containing protein [Paracoccus sp. pheM1]|uniref:autotransporter outer membrane beta-barrel domain-containing protein n=1 Tax=Paracoccus sp. pheM1 TaxID=2831675 RepID=UPI001BDB7CF5|nr:autotransporter outer membrane beta-barrel domain-containing protein [Paracoccus sp. pheM1]MBT0778918.1 autotransporter domain-containing protein [Paracoccus sp. pheM1]
MEHGRADERRECGAPRAGPSVGRNPCLGAGPAVRGGPFSRLAFAERFRLAAGTYPGSAFWARGHGSSAARQGGRNAAALEQDSEGLLLGLDGPLGDWRVGVMAGWSRTGATAAGRASTARARTWHAGLHAGGEWGGLDLRLGLLRAGHRIQTGRAVVLPDLSETLHATYGGSTLQAVGKLAYRLDRGTIRHEPFLGLAHLRTCGDGFAESGGESALAGRAAALSATVLTLGQRTEAAHDLDRFRVRTSGMIGWQHVFGDPVPRSIHGFAAGDAFAVAGSLVARAACLSKPVSRCRSARRRRSAPAMPGAHTERRGPCGHSRLADRLPGGRERMRCRSGRIDRPRQGGSGKGQRIDPGF